MLPQPATSYRSKYRHGSSASSGSISTSFLSSGAGLSVSSASQSLLDRLRTRARLTNLAVGLILGLLSFSLLVNLNFYLLNEETADG
jgi:hypothetical protein